MNSHDLGVLGIEPGTGLTRRKIMIPRNSPLPAEKTGRFATHRANQRDVVVTGRGGGRCQRPGRTNIGRFLVTDLPPDLPADTRVRVTFHYAANGRLQVRADVPAVQKQASLTIERATGLLDERIAAWAKCVAEGLPDGYRRPDAAAAPAAACPAGPTPPADTTPDEPVDALPDQESASATEAPASPPTTGGLDFLNELGPELPLKKKRAPDRK